MASKLEINIRSLIVHCEEIVKEDPKNWLLKKYIKSLDTMIRELEQMTDKPKETTLDEYKTRCGTLKTETNYVEPPKLESRLKLKSNLVSSDSVLKEINQLHDAKYTNSLRRDLLGANASDSNGLRKRTAGGSGGGSGGDDMNQAMKHHANLQEKITEDMLALTRNLKEQTVTANRIIRKDTEIVSKSSTLSEMNYTSLSKEATTLQNHSRRAWKCWMWIMIGLVMVIFIFMVLFMKIMKKRTT